MAARCLQPISQKHTDQKHNHGMEASLAATRIAIMALNLARGGHISMQSALFLTIFVYLSCNTDFQGML